MYIYKYVQDYKDICLITIWHLSNFDLYSFIYIISFSTSFEVGNCIYSHCYLEHL